MATAAADDEEEKYIWQIRDELRKEITDPIKESTVEYYNENKDKVKHIFCHTNIL